MDEDQCIGQSKSIYSVTIKNQMSCMEGGGGVVGEVDSHDSGS